MHHAVHSGHIGSSLSCIDLLIGTLIKNKKPEDSFILSKGHAATALYACLNFLGEISDQEIQTFYTDGTRLPAHPSANKFTGISFALGSLGHGIPIASGIAKANKLKKTELFSFVLISDGETNEGTLWEAAHFAVKHKLDNLIMVIDKNGLQGFGKTEDIIGDSANEDKLKALGLEVLSADGHNIEQITQAIHRLKNSKNSKPKVLIGNTIKGKGIPFMENKLEWHYLPMTESQYVQAVKEIKAVYHA